MKSLVLSGGGIKGFAFLGALHSLYKKGKLNQIDKYIGTSAGSIICLLLSIGYSPMEIYRKCNDISVSFSSITSIIKEFGFLETETISNIIHSMVKDKFGKIPTLKELNSITSKHFISTTTNLSKSKIEYLDHKSYPNLDCVKACEMSYAVPFIFKSIRYENCIYVDGGLLDNFPIDIEFEEGEDRIGIYVDSEYNIDSIYTYASKIIDVVMKSQMSKKIASVKDKCQIYCISNCENDFTDIKETKKRLFKKGCQAV